MKIAMVTHTFLPNYIGGRENHVYYLSKELINGGGKSVSSQTIQKGLPSSKNMREFRFTVFPSIL